VANGVTQGAQTAISIASIPGGIFSPYPISLGFELAGYGADIGPAFTGPIFEAPSDRSVMPNAVSARGEFCTYRFAEPVAIDLGEPRQIYHSNADVLVSASSSFFEGNTSRVSLIGPRPEFPSGVHRISWEARTQMNLVFDIAIPLRDLITQGGTDTLTNLSAEVITIDSMDGEDLGMSQVQMLPAFAGAMMPMHRGTTESTSLGQKTQGGVDIEGTLTTTIPAGAIANETPIVSTKTTWYAPALQLMISSEESDPRFGTISYRLTIDDQNVPDATLFEVPSDYRVVNGLEGLPSPGTPGPLSDHGSRSN